MSNGLPERIGASAGFVAAVGGLDSSGGAGLVRDHGAITAFGGQSCLIATAVTLQLPKQKVSIDPLPADRLADQLENALHSAAICAVKVGMVATDDQIDAIVGALTNFSGPVVFDPVLSTSTGHRLFGGPVSALWPLIRRATLVTPNATEAAALLGTEVANQAQAKAAARRMVDKGATAVLVKGGHLKGEAVDTLVTSTGTTAFPQERVAGVDLRGTGCALASAIAVGLGRGASLESAIRAAQRWVHQLLLAAGRNPQ